MKILVVSDVHSNYIALQAAMIKINALKCDIKICLGDMIGYYNQPNEVLELLKNEQFICIKGNHDKYVLGELEYKIENQEIYGINRHREIVSKENFAFMKCAFDCYNIESNKLKLHFCHTINNDFSIYLKTESDCKKYVKYMNDYDYFFYGHSHQQSIHKVEDTIAINPGSIGQQRGKSKNPTFCVLDTDNGECNFYEVSYNVEGLIKHLQLNSYDEKLINILKTY